MLRCWKGGWELGAPAGASCTRHAGKQVTIHCKPWPLLIQSWHVVLGELGSSPINQSICSGIHLPPSSTDLLHKHSLLWARSEPRLQVHRGKQDLPCPSRSSFIHVTIKGLLKCLLSAGYSHSSWRDRHVIWPLLKEGSDKRWEQRTT